MTDNTEERVCFATTVTTYETHLKALEKLDAQRSDVEQDHASCEATVAPLRAEIKVLDARQSQLQGELRKSEATLAKPDADPTAPDANPLTEDEISALQIKIDNDKSRLAEIASALSDKRKDAARPEAELVGKTTAIAENTAQREAQFAAIEACYREMLQSYSVLDELANTQLSLAMKPKDETGTAESEGPPADTKDATVPAESLMGSLDLLKDLSLTNETAGKLSAVKYVRINSDELEQRIQALLEHLTARRIAEEMDTPTYLFRLRTFFTRAQTRAHQIRTGPIERLKETLQGLPDQIHQRHTAITAQIDRANWPEFSATRDRFLKQSQEEHDALIKVVDALKNARDQIQSRLEIFESSVCGPESNRLTGRIAGDVSKKIEHAGFIRLWPMLTAIATTMFAKAVLNHPVSLLLSEHTVLILPTIFAVAYLTSLWLGRWYRSRIMRQVYDHIRAEVTRLLSQGDRPMGKSDDQTAFELAPIPLNDFLSDTVSGYEQLSNTEAYSSGPWCRIIVANLLLIVSPAAIAFLLFAGLRINLDDRTSETSNQVLYGQNAKGNICVLARGHVIYSNADNYYVSSADLKLNSLASILFPEKFAEIFPRSAVYTIQSSAQSDLTKQSFHPGSCALAINDGPVIDRGDDRLAALAAHQQTVLSHLTAVLTRAIDTGPQCGDNCESPDTGALGALLVDLSNAIAEERATLQQISTAQGDIVTRLASMTHQGPGLIAIVTPPASQPIAPETKTHTPTVWNYRLYLGEAKLLDKRNTLLLPFFPGEVRKTNSDIKTVFAIGLTSLKNPAVSGLQYISGHSDDGTSDTRRMTYIEQLGSTIDNALAASETLTLRLVVQGYASAKWDNNSGAHTNDELNYALAEGRRVAVIEKIKDAIDRKHWPRIRLTSASDTSGTCFDAWTAPSGWDTRTEHGFATYQAMTEARREWTSEPANGAPPDPLSEFIQRAVVVQVLPGGDAC